VPQEIRGPVVVLYDGGGWRPLFPTPHDVVFDGHGRPQRLARNSNPDKVEHDLGTIDLLVGDNETSNRWWPGTALRRYLHDGTPSRASIAPWATERRVGLARNPDRTAAAGMLYSAEHLRGDDGTHGRLGFAVECAAGPRRDLATTVFFGGRGRRARVHADDTGPALSFPAPLDGFPDGRLLLYLATPGVFVGGWRPPQADLLGGQLVAAAVGGPEVIAMARPDRRTGAVGNAWMVWAAAPGSVYYLKFSDEAAAMKAARQWHGRALPQADDTLRTAGFGLALTGRWE
ncbi:MAG: type III-B CRISPR module-associated Cmr3 family protein, partial [Pseudonocardiaceae bacterium]